MWLDGKLIVEDWRDQPARRRSAKVVLEATTLYDLKIEHFKDFNHARMYSAWTKPGQQSPRRDEPSSLWSQVADAIDYYFIYGPKLDDVIASYRALTGPAPMFPKWVYGFMQSDYNTSQQQLLDRAAKHREKKIPIDGEMLGWRWWPKGHPWNAFHFDRRRYPDPAGMIKTLHERYHVRLFPDLWTGFSASRPGAPSAIYDDLKAKGCLYPVPPHGGIEDCAYVDFFNRKAREAYWRGLNELFFDIGMDAWWVDATEPGFRDYFHAPTAVGPGARVLNAYSLVASQAIYEGQRRTTSDRRVYVLNRSAYTGQQRYAAATWSGDVIADNWTLLRHQISAGLNFCLSGLPYWTCDIGGHHFYGRKASGDFPELFGRWFQYGAFCPIFRVNGLSIPPDRWEARPEDELKYDHLRYRLLPYIYSLAWRVTDEGYTMMRALVMDFPDEPEVYQLDDQFMFGPAFLVNPVTEPKATSRPLYLPGGSATTSPGSQAPGWEPTDTTAGGKPTPVPKLELGNQMRATNQKPTT